ncbi:MAG: dihydroorotase [Chloroflexota bacterium]
MGVKAFLGYAFKKSTGQVLYTAATGDDDLESPPNYGTLTRLGALVAEAGLPLAVHAEDPGVLQELARPVESYDDLLAARPATAEAVAIAGVGEVSRATGVHVHVVHLGSAAGLRAAQRAIRAGARMTVETCPHYLWLCDRDYDRIGSPMKVYPPVRAAADRQALREGLFDGSIRIVASDHAPHTDAEKLDVPLSKAAAGSPGVQTLLLSALDLARQSGTVAAAVRWVCEGPARLFGLYPRKGAIEIGSHADLTLVDLDGSTRVTPESARSMQRHAALDGLTFRSRIVSVYSRGDLVAENGEPLAGPARGQFVRPRWGT